MVFSAIDADGKSYVWLAPTDRRSPPRQVPNVEGDMPFFGLPSELVVHSVEGGGSFAFRVHEERGNGKQKLASQQIYQILSISPDAQWLVTTGLPTGGETTDTDSPDEGWRIGRDSPSAFCRAQWQPDSRFFYLSVMTGMQAAGAYGKTYVLPVPHGKMLPDIPAGGFPGSCYRCTSRRPRD